MCSCFVLLYVSGCVRACVNALCMCFCVYVFMCLCVHVFMCCCVYNMFMCSCYYVALRFNASLDSGCILHCITVLPTNMWESNDERGHGVAAEPWFLSWSTLAHHSHSCGEVQSRQTQKLRHHMPAPAFLQRGCPLISRGSFPFSLFYL